MAKLVYLNHSGFLLELEKSVLVFDFYTDPAGVLQRYAESTKAFYFFVSHSHYDHWNLSILDFQSEGPKTYFLEQGCKPTVPSIYEDREDLKINFVSPGFGQRVTDEDSTETGVKALQCFGSTDEGVSFLVETEDGLVFHAGDLNAWDWEADGVTDLYMDGAYRAQLAMLQAYLAERELWLAMLPVDLRLGAKAFLGAKVFLEYAKTNYLVPDHLNGGVNLPGQLASKLAGYDHAPQVISLTSPGQAENLA